MTTREEALEITERFKKGSSYSYKGLDGKYRKKVYLTKKQNDLIIAALSPPPDEVMEILEMAKFDLEVLHEQERKRCIVGSKDMAVKLEPIRPPSLRYINKVMRNHIQGGE